MADGSKRRSVNLDNLTEEEREGLEALREITSDIGVSVNLDESGNLRFVREDTMAGLNDKERAAFSGVQSSLAAGEKYKQYILKNRYPDNYLQFNAYELNAEQKAIYDSYARQNGTAAEQYRRGVMTTNSKSEPDKQRIFDEMAFIAKANDPGYLNSLTNEEFQVFSVKYVEYRCSHIDGVYGYTADELSQMNESQRAKVQMLNQQYSEEFTNRAQLEKDAIEVRMEGITVANVESNQNGNSRESNGLSTWGKLKQNVTLAFSAVGNWIASTPVGEWVIDKYNDIFNKEDEQEVQESAETDEDKANKRAQQAAIVDETSADEESYTVDM